VNLEPANLLFRRRPLALTVSLLDRKRGAAAVGESSQSVIDPAMPATQGLERGSSVTHNSLVANQRAHISLIDRRHLRPRRVPYRAKRNFHARRIWQGHAHALDSVKPYQRDVERRATMRVDDAAELAARPLELELALFTFISAVLRFSHFEK
jgi:hypothetical protein